MVNLKSRMDRLEVTNPALAGVTVTGIWLCGPDDEPSAGRCAFLPVGSTEEDRQLNREKAYQSQGLPARVDQDPN